MSDSQRLRARPRARAELARRGVGFGHLVASGDILQHVLLIVAFAVVLRLPYFDNPAIYIDEQFYLLVADRWLHEGLIPYVGIWDRKPLGIFIVYAAGQLFGNPILGYQILALACVIATALLIWAMAARVWPRTVGLYAAMLYCVSLMLMDGQGGQSPVFYNLPVTAAAYLLLGLAVERDRRDTAGAALTAAALFGIALQIKYAAVFEAATLSLFGLAALILRHHWRFLAVLGLALGMAALGLLPTALVGAGYALIGHWQDFFFANFLSILSKDSWRLQPESYLRQFLKASFSAATLLLPSFVLGFEFLQRRVRLAPAEKWMFAGLLGWLTATFAGAVVMGKPAEHYFLPTLAPLSFFAAIAVHRLFALGSIRQFVPNWPQRLDGAIMFAALIALATLASFRIVQRTEYHWGAPSFINHSAEVIKNRLHGRCLYVFNRLPIYYYLTQSCLPTRFPFPNHLDDSSELHALPADALNEFARVLATKPVLLVRIPITSETDPAAEEMLNQALTRDYVLDQMFAGNHQTINVYVPRQER